MIINTKKAGMTAPFDTYSQTNPIVTRYMTEVSYNPDDYSQSSVLQYSYTETDYTKWFPVRYTMNLSESGELHLADDVSHIKKSSAAGNNYVTNIIPYSVSHWWNLVNNHIKQCGTMNPTGRLRMIESIATNVRDLGGWTCDGGTVRYGKLFRGGYLSNTDRDVFINQLRVKHDLDLRSKTDNGGITVSPLGVDVIYTAPDNQVWYTLAGHDDDWRLILSTIFTAVKRNEPLYFHCSAGADRTGTVACIVEALLGISQSDIDKDFEITTFAVHPNARRRIDTDWRNLIGEINAIAVGDTFRDRVVNWVGSLGFTDNDLNGFRHSMIDGNPEDVTIQPITPPVINLFDPTTALYNNRLGSDNTPRSGANGCLVTDYIDISDYDTITISGVTLVQNTTISNYGKFATYDASQANVSSSHMSVAQYTFNVAGARQSHPTIQYLRICMGITASTAISSSDVANLVITGS